MAMAECCFNCVYSFWDPCQMVWNLAHRVITDPTCGNQPDYPGQMRRCPLGPVCRNYRPRPPKPAANTVKTIPVGGDFYAYVDAADFEWLNQWVWTFHSGYAVRYHRRKQIYMHREIAKPPEGMVVDHKNRNKLDNTRDNLRISTQKENARNRGKPRGSASRFLGVGYDRHRRKWYANLGLDGKAAWLGYFKDDVEAARGYDHAAVEHFGESANLNFPREWPPERIREVHASRMKEEGSDRGSAGPAGQAAAEPQEASHSEGNLAAGHEPATAAELASFGASAAEEAARVGEVSRDSSDFTHRTSHFALLEEKITPHGVTTNEEGRATLAPAEPLCDRSCETNPIAGGVSGLKCRVPSDGSDFRLETSRKGNA